MHVTHVYICGAHGTGKTTLVKGLVESLKWTTISEIGRNLLTEMNITRDDLKIEDIRKDYQRRYVIKQCQAEEALNEQSFISDRGIDALVYGAYYVGTPFYQELLQMNETQQSLARYRRSIIIVIEPHPVCNKDDGTRMVSTEKELKEFTQKMKEILKENLVPFHLINDTNLEIPDLQKRVDQVLQVVNKK